MSEGQFTLGKGEGYLLRSSLLLSDRLAISIIRSSDAAFSLKYGRPFWAKHRSVTLEVKRIQSILWRVQHGKIQRVQTTEDCFSLA